MSTPVCLEWQNLSLTIKTKEFQYLKCRSQVEEKKILRNGMSVIQIELAFVMFPKL